jgi:hypothetical protein
MMSAYKEMQGIPQQLPWRIFWIMQDPDMTLKAARIRARYRSGMPKVST